MADENISYLMYQERYNSGESYLYKILDETNETLDSHNVAKLVEYKSRYNPSAGGVVGPWTSGSDYIVDYAIACDFKNQDYCLEIEIPPYTNTDLNLTFKLIYDDGSVNNNTRSIDYQLLKDVTLQKVDDSSIIAAPVIFYQDFHIEGKGEEEQRVKDYDSTIPYFNYKNEIDYPTQNEVTQKYSPEIGYKVALPLRKPEKDKDGKNQVIYYDYDNYQESKERHFYKCFGNGVYRELFDYQLLMGSEDWEYSPKETKPRRFTLIFRPTGNTGFNYLWIELNRNIGDLYIRDSSDFHKYGRDLKLLDDDGKMRYKCRLYTMKDILPKKSDGKTSIPIFSMGAWAKAGTGFCIDGGEVHVGPSSYLEFNDLKIKSLSVAAHNKQSDSDWYTKLQNWIETSPTEDKDKEEFEFLLGFFSSPFTVDMQYTGV